VRPEGLGKFKKITSLDIEPVTFRFVASCLDHYAMHAPSITRYVPHMAVLPAICWDSSKKQAMTDPFASLPFTSYNHNLILQMLYKHRRWENIVK
jgi:hypothetical protein